MDHTRLGATGLHVSRILSDAEIAELEAPYVPHPVLGH